MNGSPQPRRTGQEPSENRSELFDVRQAVILLIAVMVAVMVGAAQGMPAALVAAGGALVALQRLVGR
jgi:hypothetical protein